MLSLTFARGPVPPGREDSRAVVRMPPVRELLVEELDSRVEDPNAAVRRVLVRARDVVQVYAHVVRPGVEVSHGVEHTPCAEARPAQRSATARGLEGRGLLWAVLSSSRARRSASAGRRPRSVLSTALALFSLVPELAEGSLHRRFRGAHEGEDGEGWRCSCSRTASCCTSQVRHKLFCGVAGLGSPGHVASSSFTPSRRHKLTRKDPISMS